jgi:hypothetical protein
MNSTTLTCSLFGNASICSIMSRAFARKCNVGGKRSDKDLGAKLGDILGDKPLCAFNPVAQTAWLIAVSHWSNLVRLRSLSPLHGGEPKNGGERGIRTPGTVLPVQRFSKPSLSATQAPLRSGMCIQRPAAFKGKAVFRPTTSLTVAPGHARGAPNPGAPAPWYRRIPFGGARAAAKGVLPHPRIRRGCPAGSEGEG